MIFFSCIDRAILDDLNSFVNLMTYNSDSCCSGIDSRFALIDKINFPSFSPFCVLGIHHCLLLVTVHEELHVISIVNDSPLALMLSNFDSDIFNVAESESSHPINIHNNERRKISFVFINERVLYKNARSKDNVLIWNRIAYFSKYSTSLNI